MKDNNMSSNPDTKAYFGKDVFTYISFTLNKDNQTDTAKFNVTEVGEGDTAFYSKGYMVLNKVVTNPNNEKYHFTQNDLALMADVTVYSKDSMRYKATPLLQVQGNEAIPKDDTIYAQNLFVRFVGVGSGKDKKLS
ncbi:MAG: hypothetical protein IPP48_11750 [Chitinophagaceae bacterium]|nr:hypothetical protein [Chitinophagaceae bacterium]